MRGFFLPSDDVSESPLRAAVSGVAIQRFQGLIKARFSLPLGVLK